SITAYLSVNDSKHVWSQWNQLNSKLKRLIRSRHAYYGISNWEFLVDASASLSVNTSASLGVDPQQGSGRALKTSA
ncbi:MAG: hypothetical protein RLO37_04750, partial [Coleofasciculus chthonoplastes F1-TOW-03]